MDDAFKQLIERSTPPMTLFVQSTLARLMLSYTPMIDYLARMDGLPERVASFGSGSCAHEVFLSHALPDAALHCFDITSRYIPPYLRQEVMSQGRNIRFELLDLEKDNTDLYHEAFDFVYSIQTLEHVDNYRALLSLMAQAVRPGGYLYLDASYYHMEDDRESALALSEARIRQWEANEKYYLGFSPAKLARDPLLEAFETVAVGYYSFDKGDLDVLRPFRSSRFGHTGSDEHFGLGLAYLMKTMLDALDTEPDLDSHGYFRQPASAFRLLLRRPGGPPLTAPPPPPSRPGALKRLYRYFSSR